MKLIIKLTILAVLCIKSAHCEDQEEKDLEQLLKFQIPLGWGAGQLLEEDDPALR